MLLLVTALVGLAIGSFLAWVIERLPLVLYPELNSEDKNISLYWPTSYCMSCKHRLSWFENIPLLSYIYLKGRCKHCKQRISWRLPVLELGTALLSIWLVLRFGYSAKTLALLLFSYLIICISFIDYDHYLIPNHLNLILFILGLSANYFELFSSFTDALLGAALGWLLFFSIAFIFKKITKKEGLGQGDFKLLATLVAWTGWQNLGYLIFIAASINLILGCIIAFRKQQHISQIILPFAPALAIAAWIILVFSTELSMLLKELPLINRSYILRI